MFDISVNLANSCFKKDRDEVVSRACASGVNGLLIIGTDLNTSKEAQKLGERYVTAWSTVGVHPHNSREWTERSAEVLYTLAQHTKVVAIGECGFDFNRNFSTYEAQKKAFIAQMSLASELEIPLFLHCRDAYESFFSFLDPWLDKIPGAVLHCFTGSYQNARACLDRGLYLGITGWICDKRRGAELRALVPSIPVEHLLLESDSPYLLPCNVKERIMSSRNEPVYLSHIVQEVAFLRQETFEFLSARTDENVRRLFKISF